MPVASASSKAATPSILTSAGNALVANPNRTAWAIQNLGTNPLFVLLGAGASTTVFNVVLKAGTGADDGTGGYIAMETGTVYTGLITVAGTSPRFTTTELGINTS